MEIPALATGAGAAKTPGDFYLSGSPLVSHFLPKSWENRH